MTDLETPLTAEKLMGLGVPALLATYQQSTQTQDATGDEVYFYKATPKSNNTTRFGALLNSIVQNGVENQYGVTGFNPSGGMEPSSGITGVPSWTYCIENDFFSSGVHQQEWYLNYNSADKTTVQYFRPIYANILKDPDADNKQRAQIDFNIGDSTISPGQFRIKSGSTTLCTMDALNFLIHVPTITFDYGFTVNRSGFQSKIILGDNLNGTYAVQDYLAGLNKFNWRVAVQNNINNGFEITPSTAINGGTYSTPLFVLNATNSNAGIGTGTGNPEASAVLELKSTTKGLLLPRLTTAERDAISAPVAGLLVYNSSTNKLNVRVAAGWEAVTSA